MEIQCQECATYIATDNQISKNSRRMKWVMAICLVMMIGEVVVGYISGSMSLVAEGWHMGSHVGALSITLIAYWLASSPSFEKKLSFGAGKLIPLGGYTSAVILGLVAILILVESVEKLFSPAVIHFREALVVASAGLAVNIISALILSTNDGHSHAHGDGHECDHHHVHDHNIRSAFLHVLADAVTSVLAIIALSLGDIFHWNFLDPVVAIVGSLVIFVWAFQLCRNTGLELLDGHSKTINWTRLRDLVEKDGTKILDFHIWRIAPKAVACELVVESKSSRGSDYYRQLMKENFSAKHVIVEERIVSK